MIRPNTETAIKEADSLIILLFSSYETLPLSIDKTFLIINAKAFKIPYELQYLFPHALIFLNITNLLHSDQTHYQPKSYGDKLLVTPRQITPPSGDLASKLIQVLCGGPRK